MHEAYCQLFKMGIAHSVEVWKTDDELVGGLYGVASGGVFSGESMFSKERDVSKIAFVALAWHIQHWGFSLIDCQYQQILRTSRYFNHKEWIFEEDSDLAHWQPDED